MAGDALPPALPGDQTTLDTPGGRVTVYRSPPAELAQAGRPALPPLLLVHSVNAAASAAEVAPLYAHYGRNRPVWALDLPGFGLSERRDQRYTPRLMTDALHVAITHLRQTTGAGAVDLLAVSLSCEFAARVACEAPATVRRLALVSPTGFNGRRSRAGRPGSTLGVPAMYRLVRWPFWSDALFRGLTRPGVIRYFLRRTWGSQSIDEALWQYAVQTARVPGARHAPLSFLSAYLFSADIDTLYDTLRCPVWVSMATRGDFTDYRRRDRLQGRSHWQFHAVPGGALPYFEPDSGFLERLAPFWLAP